MGFQCAGKNHYVSKGSPGLVINTGQLSTGAVKQEIQLKFCKRCTHAKQHPEIIKYYQINNPQKLSIVDAANEALDDLKTQESIDSNDGNKKAKSTLICIGVNDAELVEKAVAELGIIAERNGTITFSISDDYGTEDQNLPDITIYSGTVHTFRSVACLRTFVQNSPNHVMCLSCSKVSKWLRDRLRKPANNRHEPPSSTPQKLEKAKLKAVRKAYDRSILKNEDLEEENQQLKKQLKQDLDLGENSKKLLVDLEELLVSKRLPEDCMIYSGNQSTIQLLRGFNVAETKENNEQFVAEYWNLILPGLSTLRSYLPKVSMSPKEHRKDVINVLNGYLKSLQIQEKLKGGIAFDETQIYEGLILTNDNVLVGFIEPINLIDLKKFDTSSLSATSAKNSTLNGKKPLPKTAKQSLHFVLVINSMKFALPIAYWFTQTATGKEIQAYLEEVKTLVSEYIEIDWTASDCAASNMTFVTLQQPNWKHFFDVEHLEKLTRNSLKDRWLVHPANSQSINLSMLVDVREDLKYKNQKGIEVVLPLRAVHIKDIMSVDDVHLLYKIIPCLKDPNAPTSLKTPAMQAIATYLEHMESLSKLFHLEEAIEEKRKRIAELTSYFLCALSPDLCGVCDKSFAKKLPRIECTSCCAFVHQQCSNGHLCNECLKLDIQEVVENGEPPKPPPTPTNTDPKRWITKPLRKALRVTFHSLELLFKETEEEETTGFERNVKLSLYSSNLVESLFATLKTKTPKPTAYQHMTNISRNEVLWLIKQSHLISLPSKAFVGKTSAYTNLQVKTIGEDLLQQLIKRHQSRKSTDQDLNNNTSSFKDERDKLKLIANELIEKLRPRTKQISIREQGLIKETKLWSCWLNDENGNPCPKQYLATHFLLKHVLVVHNISNFEAHLKIWNIHLPTPISNPNPITVDVAMEEEVTSSQPINDIFEQEQSQTQSKNQQSKPEKLRPILFLAVDTETSGFNKEIDCIIQFAAYDLHTKENTTFKKYIKNIDANQSPVNITPGAFAVHGITLEMVQKSKNFSEVMTEFIAWVGGFQASQVILVFHNKRFDLEFLVKGFDKWKLQFPEIWIFTCSMMLAQRLFGEGVGLQSLCKKFNIKQANAHSASEDALVLCYILERMAEEFELNVFEMVYDWAIDMKYPIDNPKHKITEEQYEKFKKMNSKSTLIEWKKLVEDNNVKVASNLRKQELIEFVSKVLENRYSKQKKLEENAKTNQQNNNLSNDNLSQNLVVNG